MPLNSSRYHGFQVYIRDFQCPNTEFTHSTWRAWSESCVAKVFIRKFALSFGSHRPRWPPFRRWCRGELIFVAFFFHSYPIFSVLEPILSDCTESNSHLCTYQFKAGGGGRQGAAWGGDLTFFKNLPSNSLPTGKLLQSNAQKFSHPGWHIAVNHSQAGCKKRRKENRKTL